MLFRMDNHEPALGQFYRGQLLAHALGKGVLAEHEHGHVGAQRQADAHQFLARQAQAPEMVQRQQRGRGI
ncbi:hypothetical protein D9M70_576550 [compost metagenome]